MGSETQSKVKNIKVEDVVKNINNKFPNFLQHFAELTLLTQKGVYPYDFMDSFEKFEQTSFPSIEDCFNTLQNEKMEEDDYNRAQNVWKSFNIKNMGEYHDLYLKTDVLLLADVFENFRVSCLKSYKLDPVHYYTLPGLAWDAMLLMTGVKLDVFSQEQNDMYLMIERGIRGGISVVTHRHARANHKYLRDYNAEEKAKYIAYLDANNLYGWSMIQHLPTKNFKWGNVEEFNTEAILKMTEDQAIGYIFDVDLEYPKELHDLHNDYPLAPESVAVKETHLSEHSKKILKTLGAKHSASSKLVPNLWDKKDYVVHYRNLKLYLELGMKITKLIR